MFEKEALSNLVHQQLTTVPVDHKIAVVAVVNQDGAKVVTAIKIKDNWQIEGYAEIKGYGKHELGFGASVQWSK